MIDESTTSILIGSTHPKWFAARYEFVVNTDRDLLLSALSISIIEDVRVAEAMAEGSTDESSIFFIASHSPSLVQDLAVEVIPGEAQLRLRRSLCCGNTLRLAAKGKFCTARPILGVGGCIEADVCNQIFL